MTAFEDKLAAGIKEIMFDLMSGAVHFLFSRPRQGRNALRRARRKLELTLAAVDKNYGLGPKS